MLPPVSRNEPRAQEKSKVHTRSNPVIIRPYTCLNGGLIQLPTQKINSLSVTCGYWIEHVRPSPSPKMCLRVALPVIWLSATAKLHAITKAVLMPLFSQVQGAWGPLKQVNDRGCCENFGGFSRFQLVCHVLLLVFWPFCWGCAPLCWCQTPHACSQLWVSQLVFSLRQFFGVAWPPSTRRKEWTDADGPAAAPSHWSLHPRKDLL